MCILSELERLANHHLHPGPFVGHGGVDADYDALGPGPEAKTDIPFHVGMQRIEVPFGCYSPDFCKGYELQPLDSNVFRIHGHPLNGFQRGIIRSSAE